LETAKIFEIATILTTYRDCRKARF